MAEISPWVQLGAAVAVGLGSAYIGSWASNRGASRRYERERYDAMVPVVREWALLLIWDGEVHCQERMGDGPSSDRWAQVCERFDQFRHDLPLDLQRRLDGEMFDDPYSYGSWQQETGRRLQAWIEDTVSLRHARTRRLALLAERLQARRKDAVLSRLGREVGRLLGALTRT